MDRETENTKETADRDGTKKHQQQRQSAEDKLLAQMTSVSPTEHVIPPTEKSGTKSLEELRGEKEGAEKLGGPPVTFLDASGKPERPRQKSAIRTYYDDVAETLQTQQTSIADIAIAENKRRLRTEDSAPKAEEKDSNTRSRVLFGLGIAVLVLAGAGALGYSYIAFIERRVVPVEREFVDSLIPADRQETILVEDDSRANLLRRLEELSADAGGTIGEVVDVKLARQETFSEGEQRVTRIPAREMLELFDTRIDAALFRSIEGGYMLGLHLFDQPHYFLMLKTGFFENAFAGMLRWETSLQDDLPFLSAAPTVMPEPIGTTTALVLEPAGPRFVDRIIANRDVRVLVDNSGEELLMYAFPNRDTLIITDNRRTLIEVFELMTVRRFRE